MTYFLSGVVITSWIFSCAHVIICAKFSRYDHKSNAVENTPNSNTQVTPQSHEIFINGNITLESDHKQILNRKQINLDFLMILKKSYSDYYNKVHKNK